MKLFLVVNLRQELVDRGARFGQIPAFVAVNLLGSSVFMNDSQAALSYRSPLRAMLIAMPFRFCLRKSA